MTLSIYIEKSFHKIQDLFIIKLGIEGMFPNIIRAVNDKPIADIILNGEILKILLLKSVMRHKCLFSPIFFNIVLEFLARAIKQEKEIKGIQIGKEKIKLSLFADNKILHLKKPERLH
jgi:hypothetical protein